MGMRQGFDDFVEFWRFLLRRFLADHGPTSEAFSFKSAFGPDGSALIVDRTRVKALAAENATGQADLLAVVKTLPV